MQRFLHPDPQLMFNTAMMKCNGSRQFGSPIQKSLIPYLTHASCVDKDECRLAAIDDRDDFINQFNSQMTRPGKFFYLIRKNGFDLDSLLHFGGNDHSRYRKRRKKN